jgi:hypothetical protein
VLFGMANGMATLMRASSVADVFGVASYGRITGAVATGATLARAAGPVGAALLRDAAGSYGPAFAVLAVTMSLSCTAAVTALSGAAGARSE